MTRPAPPIPTNYDRTGSGKARLPKRGPTEAGKQKLSEIAKARWQAGGFKATAKNPRRPRKPSQQRIATQVAEAAREKRQADAIIDVFKDAIRPTQPTHIRLKAAEAWLRVEAEDAKLMLREADQESQKRDRAELLDILSQKLTTGHSGMLLRKQLEGQTGITDAVVVDGHADDISP